MLHCSSERRAIARGHAIKPSPRTHRGDAAPATYTGVSISDLFQAFDGDGPLDILGPKNGANWVKAVRMGRFAYFRWCRPTGAFFDK
jgi:hypothetical protein